MQSQVKFNRVSEKVPEKVWEALVQQGSGEEKVEKEWEALVQSQVRFNRVPEKVTEKVPECSGEGSGCREGLGEGLGGFGAEPGQVQQGSGEGSGEGLGGFGRARPGSTGFAAI